MSSLAELQARFQRAVVEGDDDVLSEILDTSKEKRDVLLGVYRNAYVARLIEFLGHDYEKLSAYLGEAQFDDMARDYIRAHPSHTQNARWYGNALPQFLTQTAPYSESPQLGDLASLEQALNDAFDAADAPALQLEDLASVAPKDWPALTFAPHPAVGRLTHSTNAAAIWQALAEEETPPEAVTLPEPEQLIVYRQDHMAMFRPLGQEEAMMWDEAADGVAFGVLCEMVATFGGAEEAAARAAGYLQGWIQTGLLAKF